MSREIKFRAWYDQTNSMIPWERLTNEYTADSILNVPEKYELKVMQFTGLKDKNGVEIYEGDILEVDDEFSRTKHEVVWGGDDYPAWTLNPGLECEANDFSEIICGSSYTMEVIDNIYSNPELLEPPLGNNDEPIRKISEDDWRKDDR